MYMRATVTKTYRCAWKCTDCKMFNVEKGTLSRQADANVGMNQQKAKDAASAAAMKNTDRAMNKLVDRVNSHRSFKQLNTDGRCQYCGARQPWSCSNKLRLTVCALVAALIAALYFLYDNYIMFWLVYGMRSWGFLRDIGRNLAGCPQVVLVLGEIIGVVLTWKLIGWVHHFMARRRLDNLGDPHCYPLIITPSLIGEGMMNDPRITEAIKIIQFEAMRQPHAK